MTINDEIFAIANKLANKGKKPTVALIKSKLSQPTPLPTIIHCLKHWRHEPSFIEIIKDNRDKVAQINDNLLSLTAEELQHLIANAVSQQIAKASTSLYKETRAEIAILTEKLNALESLLAKHEQTLSNAK